MKLRYERDRRPRSEINHVKCRTGSLAAASFSICCLLAAHNLRDCCFTDRTLLIVLRLQSLKHYYNLETRIFVNETHFSIWSVGVSLCLWNKSFLFFISILKELLVWGLYIAWGAFLFIYYSAFFFLQSNEILWQVQKEHWDWVVVNNTMQE